MSDIKLYLGDCIEIMDKLIADGVKVDAVICDPPYGTTACSWDNVIPFEAMWDRLKQLRKENAPIVLFGSEPFSSALRMSNLREFKYDWIWDKGRGYNFASVKYQPFKSHEIVSVFSKKAHYYSPQKTPGKPYKQKQGKKGEVYGGDNGKEIITINTGDRHPLSIQKFIRGNDVGMHPTQKPVNLMEYLIKTYTKEGDIILDFAMGSGSTGLAARNLNRGFIGIEIKEKYFKIAENRILNVID